MVWEPEINEIEKRKKLAEQMGGPEGVAKQHSQGKLTVRERIVKLTDPGSFHEIGGLTGTATYEGEQLKSFTPAASVLGLATINGRKTVVEGGDFTIRGGAGHTAFGTKTEFAHKLALNWRLPYVRMLDSAGGSVRTFEELGRTYVPDNPCPPMAVELLNIVPVVSAVMGSVAGYPAIEATLAHFNVMVKGTSQVFPGGPPVVKAALGYDMHKEDLGGWKVAAKSGSIDNIAKNEDEALDIIKRFLSFMPINVWEQAPYIETKDKPNRREEGLLSIIPKEHNRGYSPYKIIDAVFDLGSFFEITPLYGQARVTGLARVNGYPVGVMINNPMFLGGSMDVAAGEKVCRFIQLCDTFHLPLVYFADEPGFMVGIESQLQGIVRAGARVVCTTWQSKMPWITFVIRQIYGVAGMCHIRQDIGMRKRYAWPSANWGSMHIEGGTTAAYRREIEAAPDPNAKREEIEKRLKAVASPFRTAEAFNIEDIIDPRHTRPVLCAFIEDAQRILQTQLGPTAVPYRP